MTSILEAKKASEKPLVVCLCGSTRFSTAFRSAALSETLAGRIVLTIGDMMQSDDDMELTDGDKDRLDILHLHKIDMADEILVLNVDGYIGSSTAREVAYAMWTHKHIRYLNEMILPSSQQRVIEAYQTIIAS